MEAKIEVTGVRKRFGPAMALDGMTFTVWPGQVTGFVGPNGAGKSTTMRVILGLDAPEEGQAPARHRRRPHLPVGGPRGPRRMGDGRAGRRRTVGAAA